MDESFHDRIADELSEEPEPPLGDLVVGALRQGRRLRLVRRARITASTLAAVVVLAAGVLLGGHALGFGQLPSASAPHLTVTPPSPVIGQPTSPTTPAAIAYRLEQLLPGGQFSHYVHSGATDLEFYLRGDQGVGRVHLIILPNVSFNGCPADSPDKTTTCSSGPGGTHVEVATIPGNCLQSTSVVVVHGNGIAVRLDLATCLYWNGTTNPPSSPALTVEQAIAIGTDPGWGIRMSSSLVAAANARFPSLAVS